MRGEVYATRYRRGLEAEVERLDPFAAEKPAVVARRFAALDDRLVFTGNGLAKYRDVFAATMGERADFLGEAWWRPSGEGLFAAASRAIVVALADPGRFDPGLTLPIYTRLSDAEEDEAAREGRVTGAVPSSGVAGPAGPGDLPGPAEAGWPLVAEPAR
jgi:N6-L-threonylcarbamoyladenine synthase